ncbi:hypothetical protein Ancab_034481, partial [Ancistrocladus abbreviatus]
NFMKLFRTDQGLKHGSAIVVFILAAVLSIVTVALAGMLALGKQLPSELGARVALLLGCSILCIQ